MTMLSAFREMQIPLLAALLMLACSGKAARAARSRSIDEGLGPTTMFPMHLRRPVAMARGRSGRAAAERVQRLGYDPELALAV